MSDARGEHRLAGNGVELVRERALAARVQTALERVYRLDRVADVGDFVRAGEGAARETLHLRQANDGTLEVSLELPSFTAGADLDVLCQIIEGVSHFVYVAERARLEREATQLELELQAEVDKWVVLAASVQTLDASASAELRARLFEAVAFTEGAQTERGQRYRVANDAANRFIHRLEREYIDRARFAELRRELRHFFHLGQEEKLRLGRAA